MRKQLYLLLACLFTVCVVHAQISQGTTLLGGDFTFSQGGNKNDGDPKSNTSMGIYIAPSISRAVRDNLLAGVTFTYGNSIAKNYNSSPPSKLKNITYGGSFFLRRYRPLPGGLNVFLEAALQGRYLHAIATDMSTGHVTSTSNNYVFIAGFNPGIAYAATRRVMLEASFQNLLYGEYIYYRAQSDGRPNAIDKGFQIGTGFSNLTVAVGFKILLD